MHHGLGSRRGGSRPSTRSQERPAAAQRIFLIDFNEGRMIPDDELKNGLAAAHPYQEWVAQNRIELDEVPKQAGLGVDATSLTQRMQAFGYARDHAIHARADVAGIARSAGINGQ